jgi:hypothetical protein
VLCEIQHNHNRKVEKQSAEKPAPLWEAISSVIHQVVVADEFGESDAVDFQATGDAGFGDTALKQAKNIVFTSGEFYVRAFAAFGSAKDDAFRAFAYERFLGALGNQVALNFGSKRKSECQHFGTDVRAESVVVLDGPDLDFAFQASVENFHNHHQTASEAGKLGANENVSLLQLGEHRAEFAFLWFLRTGDGFLDPVIDANVLTLAKAGDFEALVFNCLLVSADADVSVVHKVIILQCFEMPIHKKGPILRGRDIKRYSYEWKDLYLIAVHNGILGKGIPKIDIGKYPAIKQHLDSFLKELEKRADQGDTPYHLRSCAYLEVFPIQPEGRKTQNEESRGEPLFTHESRKACVDWEIQYFEKNLGQFAP